MLGLLISLFVFGIIGLVIVSVILAVLGAVFGLAMGLMGFLLFKVAPVLLVGWIILKLVERSRGGGKKEISAADQRWLDS